MKRLRLRKLKDSIEFRHVNIVFEAITNDIDMSQSKENERYPIHNPFSATNSSLENHPEPNKRKISRTT